MEVYEQILAATIAIQQSDGAVLGSDSSVAYMCTNGMVANSNQWSNDGPISSTGGKPYTPNTNDAPNCGGQLPYGQSDSNNNWITQNTIDGYNFGMPMPSKNYSNAQVEVQITYIANATSSLTLDGNPLSYAQIANQAWTAESQAMSAKTQIQQTSLKTPTDTYNSQIQLDQQAQQAAVSGLGNPLVDLMTAFANTLGQNIM